MKKLRLFLLALIMTVILVGCGSKEVTPDYTTEEAETALNAGEDLTGKTVAVTVDTYVPDGTLGYTIQTGEHLNFISSSNPKVKEGDEIIAKVKEVSNVLGSFVIKYEKQ